MKVSKSPTRQAIIINSASKYSELFPKATASISVKPDIALRVPIDREEVIQKLKAKNIYNEEKMSLVSENKRKLMMEEEARLQKKAKKEQEKEKIKQEILKQEEKKRLDRKMREDAKREQAYQAKVKAEIMLEKDNRKRLKSLSQKQEILRKRKEEADK